MNNIVRKVLSFTMPAYCRIIEDYFDNEVYDAETGFKEGWLPYCEYDNRPLESGNMYTIVDKRAIHVCVTDANGDLSKYGFKERESAFDTTPNERIWVNMEI